MARTFRPHSRARALAADSQQKSASSHTATSATTSTSGQNASTEAVQWKQVQLVLALLQRKGQAPAKGEMQKEIESEPSPTQQLVTPEEKPDSDAETEPETEPAPQKPRGALEVGDQEPFVRDLGELLCRLTQMHEDADHKTSPFDGIRPPGMLLQDYVARVWKYMKCSRESYVLALVYIDRLTKDQQLTLHATSVHRVFLTALVLAAKIQDDYYCDNRYYAMVGGVSLAELNSMERRMFQLLNYRLHVSPVEYKQYHASVARTRSRALGQ